MASSSPDYYRYTAGSPEQWFQGPWPGYGGEWLRGAQDAYLIILFRSHLDSCVYMCRCVCENVSELDVQTSTCVILCFCRSKVGVQVAGVIVTAEERKFQMPLHGFPPGISVARWGAVRTFLANQASR